MVAMNEEQRRRLDEMIHRIDVAMMTTAMPDGTLRSRPLVSQRLPFEGTLWFLTRLPSGTTREVRADEHVNLSYADPEQGRYVSVSGVAAVVRDRAMAERLWRPELAAWFPDGPDDPGLALVRVEVRDAEYWDIGEGRAAAGLRRKGGAGGAGDAGEEPGEHEKVRVS